MRTPSCGRASYSLCATVQATPSSSVRVGETLFPQFKAIPTAVLPAPSQKRLVRHCLTNPEVSLLAPSERSFSDCCKILQEDLSSTGSCQRIYAPARSCSATPPNVFSTEKRRVRISWNRPERPQHDPARCGSPMRAVDYLVVEPRPGPPQSSCLRPGYPPSAEPVPPEPTAPASPCPNPSNPIGIQHPFITHLISERYTNNRRFI